MSSCFAFPPYTNEFFRITNYNSTLTSSVPVATRSLSEVWQSAILNFRPGPLESRYIYSNSTDVYMLTIGSTYSMPPAPTTVPTNHNGEVGRMTTIEDTTLVTFGSLTTSTNTYKLYLVDFMEVAP